RRWDHGRVERDRNSLTTRGRTQRQSTLLLERQRLTEQPLPPSPPVNRRTMDQDVAGHFSPHGLLRRAHQPLHVTLSVLAVRVWMLRGRQFDRPKRPVTQLVAQHIGPSRVHADRRQVVYVAFLRRAASVARGQPPGRVA